MKQESGDGGEGFSGEIPGPLSSFDGGPSPGMSGDIGSPSGGTRGSEDNNYMPTNSTSNARKTVHNDNGMEINIISNDRWEIKAGAPKNETPPIKTLEQLIENQEKVMKQTHQNSTQLLFEGPRSHATCAKCFGKSITL